MKMRHFLSLILLTSAFAEEPKTPPNPEVAKIDARLSELAEIWRQDTGVINRLTNYKRTPVQEGSKAYYQCLEASKRIQQAETEAKLLKRNKAALERGEPIPAPVTNSGSGDPFATVGRSGGSSGKSAFGDLEEKEAQYDRERKKEQDAAEVRNQKEAEELAAYKIPNVAYEKSVHGPKIKNLFVGMGADKFMEIASKLAEATVASAFQDSDLKKSVQKTKDGFDVEFFAKGRTLPNVYSLISAEVNSSGTVKNIKIQPQVAKNAFKASDLKFDEFVKNFSDAYNVDLEVRLDEHGAYCRTITPEGVMIELRDFRVSIEKTVTPKETERAFD